MNCFPLFIHIFFIILYIILFSFIFNPKLENIIMIFVFILTFIGGYNLISDLSRRELFLEFEPFMEIFKAGSGFDLVKLLLFSPFTTAFILILFIISLFNYFTGEKTSNIYHIVLFTLLLFITNIAQIGIKYKNIKLAYILIPTILLLLFSITFVLIGIYNTSTYSIGKTESIPYSQLDSNSVYYKIMMIFYILIFALFFIYFVIFYTKGDKNMQYQLYSIVLLLYGISCSMIFISSNILKIKFLGKTE